MRMWTFVGSVLVLVIAVSSAAASPVFQQQPPVPPHLTVDKSVWPTQIYVQGDPGTPNSAVVNLTVIGQGDPIPGEETLAPADVVFVVDNTGSMADEIANVQDKIGHILAEMELAIPDLMVGLATYKDHPGRYAGCGYDNVYGNYDDYPFMIRKDLTTNFEAFRQAVWDMSASGGADAPESVADAISGTTRLFSWRGGDAEKIAVLMGDAAGHDCENNYGHWGNFKTTGPCPHDHTMLDVIAETKANGVIWGTIGIDGTEHDVGAAQWNYLAEQTNGSYVYLAAGDIADVIIDLVKTIIPTIDTAGEEATIVEVLPPYIVATGFSPPYTDFDGNAYTWDLGTIGIGETKTVSFTIQCTEAGRSKLVDAYPDTRLEYLGWDGVGFGEPKTEFFPETYIECVRSNMPPIANAGGPYVVEEGQMVIFDGSGSSDPEGDFLAYRWDILGNGIWTAWSDDPTVMHVFGDDWNGTTILQAREKNTPDQVGEDLAVVIVGNIAPTIESMEYFFNGTFFFRIAGEKWHNAEIHLYEDGLEVGYADITRYPGSPNDQIVPLGDISIDFSKEYSAVAYYTPMDDLVNGQIQGATPAWVIIQYQDGEERIHHTFNVNHEHTWTWEIEDFSPYFLGHNITFVATASDPGSDDLTFTWDWGDGNVTESIHYNDGFGPDPYPSPDVNPINVRDVQRHAFYAEDDYTLRLMVRDDDGGIDACLRNAGLECLRIRLIRLIEFPMLERLPAPSYVAPQPVPPRANIVI